MPDSNCPNCNFRKKYDNNPKSLLGKIWRWHANWCPGWQQYMTSLPENERIKIAENYSMKKYLA